MTNVAIQTPLNLVNNGAKSYCCFIENYTGYANPTDIFELICPSNRILIPHRMVMYARSTAGARLEFQQLRRSTPDTGGVFTTPPIYPFDSSNPASLVTPKLYTAAPGALGAVGMPSVYIESTTAVLANPGGLFQSPANATNNFAGFTEGTQVLAVRPGESWVTSLRGIALPAGFTANIYVSWQEIVL